MTKSKRLALSALFCALCCVGTMLHIPAGPTIGYINLGDAFVLLSGMILGPISGGLAAAIGTSMADLINGYAIWMPATFLIKGVCACLFAIIFKHFWVLLRKKKAIKLQLTLIFGGVLSEAVMVLGYFLYEILLLTLTGEGLAISVAASTSLLNVPFNIIQGAVAVVLTVFLMPFLLRIEDVRNLINPV